MVRLGSGPSHWDAQWNDRAESVKQLSTCRDFETREMDLGWSKGELQRHVLRSQSHGWRMIFCFALATCR